MDDSFLMENESGTQADRVDHLDARRLSALCSALGGWWPVDVRMAQVTGDLDAALVGTRAFWVRGHAEHDGLMASSWAMWDAPKIAADTNLDDAAQWRAINRLVERQVIQVQCRPGDTMLWRPGSSYAPPRIGGGSVRPRRFYPDLARRLGGPAAALIVADVFHDCPPRMLTHRVATPWVDNGADRWSTRLGIDPARSSSARRSLRQWGLWQEIIGEPHEEGLGRLLLAPLWRFLCDVPSAPIGARVRTPIGMGTETRGRAAGVCPSALGLEAIRGRRSVAGSMASRVEDRAGQRPAEVMPRSDEPFVGLASDALGSLRDFVALDRLRDMALERAKHQTPGSEPPELTTEQRRINRERMAHVLELTRRGCRVPRA